jgi:hypothetical protein
MVDGGRKMEGSSYPDVVAARGFKSLYLPFSLSPSLAALCVCARARVYLCQIYQSEREMALRFMLGRQLFSWNAADTAGRKGRKRKRKKPEEGSRAVAAALLQRASKLCSSNRIGDRRFMSGRIAGTIPLSLYLVLSLPARCRLSTFVRLCLAPSRPTPVRFTPFNDRRFLARALGRKVFEKSRPGARDSRYWISPAIGLIVNGPGPHIVSPPRTRLPF